MFKNEIFEENKLINSDLFIVYLGHEERSFFLYEKIAGAIDNSKLLIFTANNHKKSEKTLYEKVKQIKDENVPLIAVKNEDEISVQNIIIDSIKNVMEKNDSIQIDIDYSSMPSGWYCKLPEALAGLLRDNDRITFWYSEGEYIEDPYTYQTVGISSYRVYSGKPSFGTKRSRTHLIGVGYDSIRTQGLLSILDPDCFVICEAYDPARKEIHDNVIKVNSSILEQTSMHVSLFLTDIEFMIAKLKGIINEFYYVGNSDIILVPDGPKPLIFVMSMMPWIFGKEGVSCLHVLGNSAEVYKKNVKPQGNVIGFSMINENEKHDRKNQK